MKLKWRVQRLTQPIARGSASFNQQRTFFGHNPVEHRASSNRTTTTAKLNRLLHQHAKSHLNENPANLRLTATRQNRRGAPSSSHRAPEFPDPSPHLIHLANHSKTKAKLKRNQRETQPHRSPFTSRHVPRQPRSRLLPPPKRLQGASRHNVHPPHKAPPPIMPGPAKTRLLFIGTGRGARATHCRIAVDT